MKVLLVTQDEPFYLGAAVGHLLRNFPAHSEIVACCLLNPSPFGKKQSQLGALRRTVRVFGWRFLLHYVMRYAQSKLRRRDALQTILRRRGIPCLLLEGDINTPQSISALQGYEPDLIVSIAGNQIFKKELRELAPRGCLNLHTALLPEYRGLMPSFWVLRHDERRTGVSVFFMDEKLDNGPIIVQEAVEIGNRSQEELIRGTKRLGMDAIIKAVNLINAGGYELMPNPAEKGSYFTFPTRADVIEFRQSGKRFF